jgi:hypothetical protein
LQAKLERYHHHVEAENGPLRPRESERMMGRVRGSEASGEWV